MGGLELSRYFCGHSTFLGQDRRFKHLSDDFDFRKLLLNKSDFEVLAKIKKFTWYNYYINDGSSLDSNYD